MSASGSGLWWPWYSHAVTLEEGTGMADEENRRGKLHHPVTDPPNHIQPFIYLSSVSSMYHHKEEPMKTQHFPTTDDPYFLTNVEQRSKRTRYFLFLGTSSFVPGPRNPPDFHSVLRLLILRTPTARRFNRGFSRGVYLSLDFPWISSITLIYK